MVDTQQLLAWPVGFSLNAVDLLELDNSSHSLEMKHMSTYDYASMSSSISSSSIQSSTSPSLSCISPVGMAYDPGPSQSEEHLTNMDYTHLHSYRTEVETHSKSCLCKRLTKLKKTESPMSPNPLAQVFQSPKTHEIHHLEESRSRFGFVLVLEILELFITSLTNTALNLKMPVRGERK